MTPLTRRKRKSRQRAPLISRCSISLQPDFRRSPPNTGRPFPTTGAPTEALVSSRYLRQLVDDAELFRDRVFREAGPGAAGQLADKDVAAGVDGDAVGRGKL